MTPPDQSIRSIWLNRAISLRSDRRFIPKRDPMLTMTANEAKEYGMIDEVLSRNPEKK